MSRPTIENRLDSLENRLRAENERHDVSHGHFSIPKSGSLRKPIPAPFGEFKSDGTPVRPRKPLDLPFIRSIPKQDPTETENKLKEIYKMQGKLKINGVPYSSTTNDLEDLGELGSGSCGNVVKMLHKQSGEVIAVKQMRRSGNTDENKRIIMDLEVVLKSHDCPYIVQCLGCFITEADVWICMELMATCFDKLLKRLNRPIPEDILGKVTVATVNALSYLKNKHGVIHRDVKPSNILLDERGRIKLCDFGISGRLVDSKAKTRSAGCAAYMAPERIDLSLMDYDIRADVWSLGITLVELATGQFPYFGCNNDFEVLTKVLEEDPPSLSQHGGFSMDFQDFVNRCLTKDYMQRPKYDELLRHSFVIMYTSKEVDVAEWFRLNDSHLSDKFTNQRRFSNTPPISPKNHITRRFFTFRNANDSKVQRYDTLPHNGGSKDGVKHYTSCTSYVSTNFLNEGEKVLNTRPSKYTTLSHLDHGYNDLSGRSYNAKNLLEHNLDKTDRGLNFVPGQKYDSKNMDCKNLDKLDGKFGQDLESRSIPNSPRLNDRNLVNQYDANGEFVNKFIPSPLVQRHNLNYLDKYETIKSSANSKSDFNVLNKLRNGSPSFQRRCETFEESSSSGGQGYGRPVYKTSDVKYGVNSGEHGSRRSLDKDQLSPFIAKRNVEPEGFWQVTNKEPLSPGFNRKRMQQFTDQYNQQVASRSANTSPLLLERFYHQQNQHRRQASCSPQRQHQSHYVSTTSRKILCDSPNSNGSQANSVDHQMSRSRQESPSSDIQRNDSQEGWLDSLTGAVKRRFASCIKVQLRGNEPRGGGNKLTQNGAVAASSIQMLGNSSPVHHSDAAPASSGSGNICVNKLPEYLDHRRRHQSPDPPPRLNRENPASPLAIHRSYLERLSSSPQSPSFQRRYPLTPQPPPRRLIDTNPQSLSARQNRLQFTPNTAMSDDR